MLPAGYIYALGVLISSLVCRSPWRRPPPPPPRGLDISLGGEVQPGPLNLDPVKAINRLIFDTLFKTFGSKLYLVEIYQEKIPRLRQKSQKRYPDGPHIPINSLMEVFPLPPPPSPALPE